ncbi:hypothetical protein M9H77_09521 [Catharanthus roseus]|uniref:Uncharacterized protein n=1 Tax=Catharanthus roseus TaxID=4058 RepID=A0ACC0C0W7_CATRO|nr:hypothetical protein M9H77_09521 [Catharanthus roseus]
MGVDTSVLVWHLHQHHGEDEVKNFFNDHYQQFLREHPGLILGWSGHTLEASTFNTLLKGLVLENRIIEANQLFMKLARDKACCEPNTITYSTCINGLCKSGFTERALALLSLMEQGKCKPCVSAYNTVMDSLCKKRMVDEALKLFRQIMDRGIVPDVVTYTSLMHGKAKDAEDILSCMIRRVEEPMDIVCWATWKRQEKFSIQWLIKAYETFHEMKATGIQPSFVTHCTLLDGLCKNIHVEEALSIFYELKTKGDANISMYNVLIGGLLHIRKINEAKELFVDAISRGLEPNVRTYNVMVCDFVQEGLLHEANDLLREMELRLPPPGPESLPCWHSLSMANLSKPQTSQPGLYCCINGLLVQAEFSFSSFVFFVRQQYIYLPVVKLLCGPAKGEVPPCVLWFLLLIIQIDLADTRVLLCCLGFRAQLESLSESRHISAASTPKCKETCNATIGFNGQGPDPKTRSSETSPASRSQYQPNTVPALNYQTTALPKIGQNIRLQTLGAPTRSALRPTSVSNRLGHTLRGLRPSSSGSTLPSLNRPRHWKRPSYGGLAMYSAILLRFRIQDHNQNRNSGRNGVFICVYNREAICPANRTESSHEYFQQRSPSASSPHAYATTHRYARFILMHIKTT